MDLSNISEAKVYCGTYAKYNDGSIQGDWLTFSDYSDSEEFFAACAELHKDESDPEFMFQDSEDLPDSLYSESLGEKDVNKIYEYIEVAEKVEGWDDSDWLSAHNTYCSESGNSDSEIYTFDEDFFDTFFEGKAMEAARATHFGEVNWNDEYIKFNGYGNLESISKYALDSEIDKDAILTDMLENARLYA